MNAISPWLRVVVAIAVSSSACGQTATGENGERSSDFRRYVTSRFDPDYPREAREHGLTGVGSASLTIDPRTGLVKSVTITKSTGHKILDKAAIKAYRRWRFVLHTISSAEVPIVFQAFGALDPTLLGRDKGAVIYAPTPDYPEETTPRNFSVSGVVVLQIDQRSGVVTSAQMERSTSHQELDDAILRAYRRWLFRPGTVSRMRIPVRYVTERLRY